MTVSLQVSDRPENLGLGERLFSTICLPMHLEIEIFLSFTALPQGRKVVSVCPSGVSDYCNTFRIELEMLDESSQVFFQKV